MFVRSKHLSQLGIGRLLHDDGETATLEFFDSPQNPVVLQPVPSNSIQLVTRLPAQTRVYVRNATGADWRIGRVLQHHDEDVEVAFPHGERAILSSSQVYVRWSQPIEDPTSYLANFITETPRFAQARTAFVARTLRQRNRFGGLSAYASSSIELLPHQYEVVRRVLLDPCQRYLLADEVGLGKTIEAGALIRQCVFDHPATHAIVILVPPALVMQWQTELRQRFHLAPFLGISVHVIAMDNLELLRKKLCGATMLVIDEVHQVTDGLHTGAGQNALFDLVNEAAQKVDRLLLLSATPALGNEKTFLAMLHLLEPQLYPLEEEERFRDKIRHRAEIAQIAATLAMADVYSMPDHIQALQQMFPKDALLQDYCDQLFQVALTLPDENDPALKAALQQLRTHLSETYKLNRRILRNRRSTLADLMSRRNGVAITPYQSTFRERLEQALETWREAALAITQTPSWSKWRSAFAHIYGQLLDACLSDPGRLALLLEARQSTSSKAVIGADIAADAHPAPLFPDEAELLAEIESALDMVQEEGALLAAVVDQVKACLADANAKIVVFCSGTSQADELAVLLDQKFPRTVVRHQSSVELLDEDDDEYVEDMALQQFLFEPACRVIVCDRYAEDGLNLQGGKKIIIHADLPLSPNRIEQRMGRVDRFGNINPIRSYALLCTDCDVDTEWLSMLADGFGVFRQSIASLQYMVSEQMQRLFARLFEEGLDALQELHRQLVEGHEIDKELERLRAQDLLDSIEAIDESAFEVLEDEDCDYEGIKADVEGWACDTLLFRRIETGSNSLDQVVRFEFSYGEGQRQTLFPLQTFVGNPDFIAALDVEAVGSTARHPRTFPYAFRREAALRKRVMPLRIGDTFWQGLIHFTDADERGRSFGFWRFQEDYDGEIDVFFRFDFSVYADVRPALGVVTAAGLPDDDRALRRRGDMFFAPFLLTLWLDADGLLITDPELLERLNRPYLSHSSLQSDGDANLNPERWAWVQGLGLPALDDWAGTVGQVRKEAGLALFENELYKTTVQEALDSIENQHAQHMARLLARREVMQGREAVFEDRAIAFEDKLHEALRAGITKPGVMLDAIGAVFLSNRRIP